MSSELLAELDVRAALDAELAHVPDLLPKQLVDLAAQGEEHVVTDYIVQLAHAGTPVQPAASVVALKWRHGRRTVAALSLHERALYRAVVQSLQSDLLPRVRGQDAFDSFQEAPLSRPGVTHVVMTDLANYYSSIDPNRLSGELLRRTGRWAQVDWLRRFWETSSAGFGGIPQMNPTSDIIGDTYADLLHRGLLRLGFQAWRYADDFRIACTSYGECVSALEEIDELARQLGLSLNERKTLTPKVEKYRDITEGPQRRLDRINAEVTADLTGFDPYSGRRSPPKRQKSRRRAQCA